MSFQVGVFDQFSIKRQRMDKEAHPPAKRAKYSDNRWTNYRPRKNGLDILTTSQAGPQGHYIPLPTNYIYKFIDQTEEFINKKNDRTLSNTQEDKKTLILNGEDKPKAVLPSFKDLLAATQIEEKASSSSKEDSMRT